MSRRNSLDLVGAEGRAGVSPSLQMPASAGSPLRCMRAATGRLFAQRVSRSARSRRRPSRSRWRRSLGIPLRWAFQEPERLAPTNTYVVVQESLSLRNHLAVRDTLRADPALREQYAAVKRTAGALAASGAGPDRRAARRAGVPGDPGRPARRLTSKTNCLHLAPAAVLLVIREPRSARIANVGSAGHALAGRRAPHRVD
jgi:GrpB protein